MTNLEKLLSIHDGMLEENAYCYFELAYTRQTGWMSWICSKPREDDPDRFVLAKGQGSTPEEAALNAFETMGQTALPILPALGTSLQSRVHPWLIACFGAEIAGDKMERNHRFLEESIELVQSLGCTQSEAHQLVDYVFNRPTGEPHQEVGGTMITLAALCLANGLDMDAAGEDELARIWTKIEKIRAKQAAKPTHSPLAEEFATPAPMVLLADILPLIRALENCGEIYNNESQQKKALEAFTAKHPLP